MATTEAINDVLEVVESPELLIEESGRSVVKAILMAVGVAAIVAAIVTVVVRKRG